MSLRTRLLVGLAMVAAVLGLASYLVTTLTSSHLLDQIDSQLADVNTSRRERFGDRPFGDQEQPSTLYYAEVYDDGTLRVRLQPNLDVDRDSLPALDPDMLARAAVGKPFTVPTEDDDGRWRVLVTQSRDHLEVTALSLESVDSTVKRLVWVEAISSLAVVGTLGLVGWWVMRLGVRPLKQMTAVAADIASGDLSHRVPEAPAATEAGQLGAALNQMLATIEEAFDERRRTEDRLKQFVSDASHELRTPITTVRGYAELYRRGGLPPGPDLDDAIRRMEQETIRMGGLVDDLLHLARLDQGRPLERVPVRLDRLAVDATADLRATAPDRAVTLDAVAEVWVLGDEARLRQVMANLLTNARVHTPPSSAIDVAVRRDGPLAVFEVTDRGPGMPADVAARVFERFFRADPARARNTGGSGLGLSIVQATVEALGGRVTLRSTPADGTTVRVELPATDPTPTPALTAHP